MFTKMAKITLKPSEVSIPEGVQAELAGTVLKIKGPKGELTRDFRPPKISIKLENNKLTFSGSELSKQVKAILGTFKAHVENMILGVTNGFTYEMKIVYSHFPMTVKQSGNIIEIHNFLGEKAPRKARIVGDSKVKIEKDKLTIEGINKEDVAQTTANIELATRVKHRDTRIFQDGIYIIKKG